MIEERLRAVESELHPLLFEGSNRAIASSVHWWAEVGLTVRVVRGRKMRSRTGLFDEFAAALQFPLYFGENADAFDECVRDLGDSLPAGRGYVIVITEPDQLLADARYEELAWVAGTLGDACEELARPAALGETRDRPGVPFHVVLAGDREALGRAARRWVDFGHAPVSVGGAPAVDGHPRVS
jgi:hypothetical protein